MDNGTVDPGEILFQNYDSVTVTSKNCPGCNETETFQVSHAGYIAWNRGKLIQEALPELTVDQRERLITGYCPKCWDKLFPQEEE